MFHALVHELLDFEVRDPGVGFAELLERSWAARIFAECLA